MAVKARYTQPMQIVATPEMRAEVKAIADTEDRSLADVYRELIQCGLDRRRRLSSI